MDDISLSDIFMLFAILIGVCIVFWIIFAAARRRQNVVNNAQPVRKERAKVVDKQQLAPNTFAFEIWVMFELTSGQRLRLTAKTQNSLIVGDEGMLTWQGSRLLAFQRTAVQ